VLPRLIALVCLFCSLPSTAHAGACPDSSVVVFPTGDEVPLNTEVRVAFQSKDRVVVYDLGPNRAVRHRSDLAPKDAQVLLREKDGHVVAASTQRLPGTVLPVVVLHPKRPLRPATTYEVVIRHERDHSVAEFTTGKAADTHAPALREIRRARLYRVPIRDWKDPPGPVAQLQLKGVADDAPQLLRVEIHDLTGAKDASENTLRAIVGEIGGVAEFGGVFACHDANFVFPTSAKPARRRCRGGRTLPIGVRLIDAAGNESALRKVDLDIDCFRTHW